MNTPIISLRSGAHIGPGHPCFLVAEIGNNHQGEMELARRMVRAAAQSGANAVKFQKRRMEAMFTPAGLAAPYTGPNSFGATYGEHRAALELSIEQLAELKVLAESLGLVFFASAWDHVSLRELLDLDVQLLKIGSADLTTLPLLRQAAASRAPLILSTGMSEPGEIDAAVSVLREYHDDVILLLCNSAYPCPDEETCVPAMERLRERHGLNVGYSGHERGLGPSLAALARGARVIERHFTLDAGMRGTDHAASLTPEDFARLVGLAREMEKALSRDAKPVFAHEMESARKLRKSLVAARDLPAGRVLAPGDLTAKCPGRGVSPLDHDHFMGMVLAQELRKDEMLSPDMVEDREAHPPAANAMAR